MLARSKYFLAGIALAVALSAAADQFPSRPTFQKVTINAPANSTGASINGNSTAGQSFGLGIFAGTNSSDYALRVENQAQSANYFQVDGAGNISAPNAATVPWGTQTIHCLGTCSLSGMVVGQSAVLDKPGNTSRTSTTTLANDPDLQFTSVPNGTYIFQLAVRYSSSASVGIKYYLINSTSSCVGSMTGDANALDQGATAQGQDIAINPGTNAGAGTAVQAFGMTLSPSALSLCWAQNTSSATATTVLAGSVWKITRVQ